MYKNSLKSVIIIALFFIKINTFAQDDKMLLNNNSQQDNVVMTWNKTTPEQEMKDDIKALSNKGITIKYSKVKRNSKNEITAIKVEYSDRKGNSGEMELNNQNPINTIRFYKQNDEIGFGQPSNSSDMMAGNNFFDNFSANPQEIFKQFNFRQNGDNPQSFSFDFPNGEDLIHKKSKIKIQQDGKKPLVIEDGKVIEGGDDYTAEELEKIKNENKIDTSKENLGKNQFDFRNDEGLQEFKNQMQNFQDKLLPNSSNLEKTKKEMLDAKEEMLKAKAEMEQAKKELEKAKTVLKTQKA